jgi:hypothetical protein
MVGTDGTLDFGIWGMGSQRGALMQRKGLWRIYTSCEDVVLDAVEMAIRMIGEDKIVGRKENDCK